MKEILLEHGTAVMFDVKKDQSFKIISTTGGQVADFLAFNFDDNSFVSQDTTRDYSLYHGLRLKTDSKENRFIAFEKDLTILDSFGRKAFKVKNFSKDSNQLDMTMPGCHHRLFEDGRMGCRDLFLGVLLANLDNSKLKRFFCFDEELYQAANALKKNLKKGAIDHQTLKTALMLEFKTDYLSILDRLISPRIIPGSISFFMKVGFLKKGSPKVFKTELSKDSFVELTALNPFSCFVSACPGSFPCNPVPGQIKIKFT